MEWQPIEKAKKLKKGMIRVYSYKPVEGKNYLSRYTGFESRFGSRECDLFIDIPAPPTNNQTVRSESVLCPACVYHDDCNGTNKPKECIKTMTNTKEVEG